MRYGISIDDEFATAIGYAVYAFTLLEWNIAWCAQRVDPLFLESIRGRSAEKIGKRALQVAQGASALSRDVRKELVETVEEFRELVNTRNRLVHAKPCTDPQGRGALSASDGLWTAERLADATRSFLSTSLRANALLHGALKET